MNTKPRVYAMIVAAGRGSRFGADIPKQYFFIQGQTLLQHSVARLGRSKYLNDCLLVIAADDKIAQTLDFTLPTDYAIGGTERWQSVQAGLEAIINKGAHESDLILIHDAARPAVPYSDINKVLEAAMSEPYGAILATPVADTLKESYHSPMSISSSQSDAQSYIKRTIDRTSVWQAQTPQVFRIGKLRQVLDYISEKRLTITDEASAFEYLKMPIRLVIGSRENIKLTYPDDASLLTAILKSQQ